MKDRWSSFSCLVFDPPHKGLIPRRLRRYNAFADTPLL